MKKILLAILLLNASLSIAFAQKVTVLGKITNATTNEPLIQATIKIGEKATVTDIDGQYNLELDKVGNYNVLVSYIGFENLSKIIQITPEGINEGGNFNLNFALNEGNTLLQTTTVTAGKYEKALSEVTVSLDVIKPQLIENVNTRKVDDVLQKVPGVNIVDGQANIRGGSGWSYGAGSRVLLLVDDIPALQPDAGFPNWKDIAVENIEQIEVVKGAASALYGSAAMNGIINIRTGFAKEKAETKFSTQSAFYLTPKDEKKKWWDKTPYEATASLSHKQKYGKLDFVGTLFYYNFSSYNKGWYDKFGRFTTAMRYRITDRLSIGVNANVNTGAGQNYFYWLNETSSAYIGNASAYSSSKKTRFTIDPYLSYFDKSGNRHKILTRFFSIDNQLSNNQSNKSQLYYGEYQFQRQIKHLVFTAGLVGMGSGINAKLYGDTTYKSFNIAAYAQSDLKFGKLNISAGVRYEKNTIHGPKVVRYTSTLSESVPNNGVIEESKPVFRLGVNYQIADYTYLRASWGQGYRFPTVAEMFISTNAGGIPIIPNPFLTSESGWTGEVAVKQGFKLGGMQGFVDAALFQSEYKNMMEFQGSTKTIGFQSQNVGNTIIKGYEVSVAGQGKIGSMTPSVLIGYTYIDPKYKDFTPAVRSNSTADFNVLKYRFKHNFKFDAELAFNKFSFGGAVLYNSEMQAVDKILEILTGVKAYRAANQHGFKTVDIRASVKPSSHLKLTVIGANLLNEEYSYRPALLEAPRNISARVDWIF